MEFFFYKTYLPPFCNARGHSYQSSAHVLETYFLVKIWYKRTGAGEGGPAIWILIIAFVSLRIEGAHKCDRVNPCLSVNLFYGRKKVHNH